MDTEEFFNKLCFYNCNVEFAHYDTGPELDIKIQSNIEQEDLYDMVTFIKEHIDYKDCRISAAGEIYVR